MPTASRPPASPAAIGDEVTDRDLEAFRSEAVAFLDRAAFRRPPPSEPVWGRGSDVVSPFDERTDKDAGEDLRRARAWRMAEFDAGFGWITGPPAYGGRGLSVEYERAYRIAKAEFDTPSENPLILALGMVGPAILAFGQPAVRSRYLRGIYRGELVACQLFSEPDAGSDLAAVRTRAVRRGDGWTLTGQKVWTSGAHLSDLGEVLTRTDVDAPKHRGITAFLLDMQSPGVEVRPLRQMTGGSHFNEVILDDVYVPDDHRLGEVNGGWRVATSTLMNERMVLGASTDDPMLLVSQLIETARRLGVSSDPLTRDALAGLYAAVRIAGLTNQRALEQLAAGEEPGPELSVGKLTRTDNVRRTYEAACLVLGPRLLADDGSWGAYTWTRYLLGAPASRLAGGTDEVQRNILAERVLHLPR